MGYVLPIMFSIRFSKKGPIEYDQYGNAIRKIRPPPPEGYEYVDSDEEDDDEPPPPSRQRMSGSQPPADTAPGINDYYARFVVNVYSKPT